MRDVINAILKNRNDKYFKKFNEHHSNDADRKERANFTQHFLDNDDCREIIFARIQEQKLVPLCLIKQDYKDPEPGKENVTVEADGVNGTRTMEQALSLVEGAPHLQGPMRALVLWGYRVVRRKSRKEENCNAILECLSTAVAGVFMNTQKQKLIQGEYSGQGLLKFMTCSEWIEGFSDFEHQVISNGITGFLVARDESGKKLPPRGQCYISDNSVHNLGQQLIFPLLSYDYDSLGSRGQNKGRVGNEFFGIDFGHSFRERNQIIALLQDDFSLIKQAPTPIKNISIFSDTILSEKMQGILLLYKLRTQTEKLPANIQLIVDSYGAEFADKFAKTHYGQDVAIFDYYAKLFSEKSLKDSSRAEEYKLYKGKVTNAKDYYLESANILLEKFKSRILLTAQQLDFLDNLEKLCSDTTNKYLFQSGEHKGKSVHFNHLQKCVTKRPRVEFQFDYQEGSWLSIRMISKNSQQTIETIKKFLEKMQKNSLDAAHLFLCFRHDKNGDIIFNIHKSDFEKYCAIFSEDKIATFKDQPLAVQPAVAIDREKQASSSCRMSI